MGHCTAAIQTPNSIQKDHPFIADHLSFECSFFHKTHQTSQTQKNIILYRTGKYPKRPGSTVIYPKNIKLPEKNDHFYNTQQLIADHSHYQKTQ
jgi:hypothetical protein